MKLLNHTSKYLAIILVPLMTIWAVVFYYAMLDEIYDSLDDGLKNQKILLLERLPANPEILDHNDLDFNSLTAAVIEDFQDLAFHKTSHFI